MQTKTLEQIKFEEIHFIECMTVTKLGKEVPICRVHTIDGKDYQIEPTGLVFEKKKILVKLK